MSFAVWSLIKQGGPVMWPLLGLSVAGVAVCLERGWRLLRWNNAAQGARSRQVAAHLRRGEEAAALRLAGAGPDPDAALVRHLLAEPVRSEAAAIEALELQEGRLKRGFPFLASVIVAAPMLGVLGTVLGVIRAFAALTESAAQGSSTARLGALSGGISESLVATATGIAVALVILFPYNILRGVAERIAGRLEGLAAAAIRPATAREPAEAGMN